MKFNIVFTKLKVSLKHRKKIVEIEKNKLNKNFIDSLLKNGYIYKYIISQNRKLFKIYLNPFLVKNEINNLKLKFKSSKKTNYKYILFCKKYKKSDFFFVSTNKGIFKSNDFFFYNLGGVELLNNDNYK